MSQLGNPMFMAGFTPANIAGGVLWLDASITPTGAVATWTDQFGTGNNATQATGALQPICTANQLNGKNTVLFTGASSQILILPSPLYSIPNGANTIFAVSKRNTETGSINIVLSAGTAANSTSYGVFYETTAGSIAYRNNGIIDNTGNTSTNYNIIVGRYNGGTTVFNNVNNNTATFSGNGSPNPSITTMSIGARVGDSLFLDGGIAEIIVYNNILAFADMLKIEKYLSAKWGIAIA